MSNVVSPSARKWAGLSAWVPTWERDWTSVIRQPFSGTVATVLNRLAGWPGYVGA
jgi:hypothetical protein